jgi:opacity protein-like surface antigen
MRHSILFAAAVVACLATGSLNAEDATAPAQGSTATAAAPTVETAVAIGTVTAKNDQRHSFTFKEDGSDDTLEYRAYFRSGDVKAMLEVIKNLQVGDRRKITYTENEGRRAIKIEAVDTK